MEPEIIVNGTFGKIYRFLYEGKTYVIKSQKVKKENHYEFNKTLNSVIEEYIFNTIASALGFGPHI